MDTLEGFIKVIETAGLASIDNARLAADLKELNVISDALPKDNVYSMDDCLRLERLCIRGMNICDYWVPIVHIITSEKESERDIIKNNCYITAGKGEKCTAEMRKAIAESNADYNNVKNLVERVKALKLFFDKKRETFRSAIFVFKDQLASYKVSDKGNSGEEIDYSHGEIVDKGKKPGKVNW